ncbi:hypothetical protein AEYBE204_09590 [Asticcacaulis sp. YBE204]|nr:hypothetical protein AEYBE204_09590 [Asticcacaulis sp. YBE204]
MDVVIGAQIRKMRKARGIGPAVLAGQLGVTHQQLTKYENGLNRLSATKLFEVARLLEVPLNALYVEQEGDPSERLAHLDFYSSPAGVRLAREFQKLPSLQRAAVMDLIRSLAASKSVE